MSSLVEMIPTKINGEYDIILPKHRAERPEYHTNQGWERKRLDAVHKSITEYKGVPKVYYVGAEEGEMAALCQMWGANLLLFEPNERVLPNIKAIWKANKLPSPELFIGFAGNYTDPKISWAKRMSDFDKIKGDVIGDHGFQNLHERVDAPVAKIDDLVIEGSISPTHISIDTEGSEWEVLRGAENILKVFKPVIFLSLHAEFLFQMYNEYSADLRKWIMDFGYEETLIDYALHETHLMYTVEV